MPTTLTTPVVKNATKVTIESWTLTLARDNAGVVDPLASSFHVSLSLRYADGSIAQNIPYDVPVASLPVGAANTIRTFHTAVAGFLRTAGVLAAGTDTADF